METRKKKSFKRLFAFLMAFVMVTTLAASAVFAADPTFKDVPKTHEFYDEIEDLAARKIIKGYGTSGNFGPEDNLTRAQAAKMVALGAGIKVTPGFKTEFKDVDSSVDMYKEIWALEEEGIVKGFGKTNEFRPGANIQRGHVAKMIVQALDLEEGAFDYEFTDLPKDDDEVAEAIEILASNDIVHGYGSSSLFKPAELVTRGQFSKMLSRALAIKESKLKVEEVTSAGNEFRETQAAGDMVITIKAKYDGNDMANLGDTDKIKKIVVKLNGVVQIATLDYTVSGMKINIKQAVLNALAEGVHNVDISLDHVELPTQKITVKKLKQAGLEATIAPVEVVVGAANEAVITLDEYDALGNKLAASNLNGVVVKVDGVALKATDIEVPTAPPTKVVKIKGAYIKELKVGEYEFEIVLLNGLSAKVDFEVFDKSALKLGAFEPDTRKVSDTTADFTVSVKKVAADGATESIPSALKSVKVNGVTLSSTRYAYANATGTLTLQAAYLNTLALGEYSVVVEADDMVSKASKFKVVEGDLAKATFDIAKKTEVKAFSPMKVVVELKDVKGNILKEKTARISVSGVGVLSLKATEGYFYSYVDITTDKSGKATLYYKSDVAGEAYLYAGTDGVDVRSEKFTVVPIVTLEGSNVEDDYHTNASYGNTGMAISDDYKVTGMLKYHKTGPAGLGFGDKEHYFLVFTIKGMPNPLKVVIEGKYDGEATSKEFNFTGKASETWVYGVEEGENVKITFTYGAVTKVVTLDLSGLVLED